MARSNSPEVLRQHGFTPLDVWEWREKEHKAGHPSGLDDFFRAHAFCVECGGAGKLITGVRWRDELGVERAENGPVPFLVRKYSLESLTSKLTDALKWDYLYETCSSCQGCGKVDPRSVDSES